jgi:hypothetical protein
MSNTPADIANQALDAAAIDLSIGDLEEGTRPAQVLLRAYGQCLRQLLRAAHWDFSRRQAPLTLLADATGQTPDTPTLVPRPWAYEYAYPTDCMKARFVPRNLADPGAPAGNIAIPNTPLMTGLGQCGGFQARLEPARFLVANDTNYVPEGTPADSPFQGISPTGRTVILTNQKCAWLVYTGLMVYPSVWDPMFRAAMVAYLASEVALPLSSDKKFGMQMRQTNIAIAREKIMQARISDGNEGFYSSDIRVDWMQIRNAGGGRIGAGGFGEAGVLGYGWDSCGFGDGTAF